jgi:histidyl-tRNA synthetase
VAAPGRDVFVAVAVAGEERERRALAMVLAGELRKAGLSAELDLAGRGLKSQIKHADRIGARRVVILEEDGAAQLRDMRSGEQRAIRTGNLIEEITGGEV